MPLCPACLCDPCHCPGTPASRVPAPDAAAVGAQVQREAEAPSEFATVARGDLRTSGARPVPVDPLASLVHEVARERGRDGLDLLHELVETERKRLNAERRELELDVLATAARNARTLVSDAQVGAMSDELSATETAAWGALTELAEAADRERTRLRRLREGT